MAWGSWLLYHFLWSSLLLLLLLMKMQRVSLRYIMGNPKTHLERRRSRKNLGLMVVLLLQFCWNLTTANSSGVLKSISSWQHVKNGPPQMWLFNSNGLPDSCANTIPRLTLLKTYDGDQSLDVDHDHFLSLVAFFSFYPGSLTLFCSVPAQVHGHRLKAINLTQ